MLKFFGVVVVVFLITLAIWHFVPVNFSQSISGQVASQINNASSAAAAILSLATRTPSQTPPPKEPVPQNVYRDPAWPLAYINQMQNPPSLPFYPSGY